MTLKYKHIPSGQEFELKVIDNCKVFVNGCTKVHPWIVEFSNSKDWEKIEPKEYLITKFIDERGRYWFPTKDGKYALVHDAEGIHLDLSKAAKEIISIKRLSDGEVFQIGDEVVNNQTKNSGNVKKIYIDSSKELRFEGNIAERHAFSWFFNSVSHAPKREVLFTTEDGVDIFDRFQIIHVVNSDMALTSDFNSRFRLNANGLKYFSTKEAAEEYIWKNKPVFSYNDLNRPLVNTELLAQERSGINPSK